MQYRRLGKTGLKISALSLGSWLTFENQYDAKTAAHIMQKAHDLGINFFDNAEIYAVGKSELVMGEALKKLNWSRDSFVISSKVYWGGSHPTQSGLSRKHITDACNNSLVRLGVDYIDLYFCHRQDPDTSIEEIVFTMDSLIRRGKILYWGTSEWEPQRIIEAILFAKQNHLIPPVVEQFQYNMFSRIKAEKELDYIFSEYGLGTTISMPLACGLLTGKYNNGIPENSRADNQKFNWFAEMLNSQEYKEKITKVIELSHIANALGITMAQLAIIWSLKNSKINSLVLGVSNLKQLEENVDALLHVDKIDNEIMNKIELILENKPVIESTLTFEQVLPMA
jgi:voltage-dependent potassium channel beta subunit